MNRRQGSTPARRARHALTALGITGALVLWQGAALAGTSKGGGSGLGDVTDVVNEATGQIEDTTDDLLDEVTGGLPGGNASDDQDPSGSGSGSGSDTTAEGHNLGLDVADQEVVRAGGSEASAGGGNSESGATILAVLGHQILGTSSEHDDTGWEESTFGTLGFTCAASEGNVCVDLLYAHSWADGTSSSSDTDAAYVCLAGGQTAPDETCQGPVALRVLDSHSDASDAGASQSSEGARLCLGNEDADGVCQGVGVSVIESESANTGGEEGGSTTVGSLEARGEEQGSLGDGQAIEAPSECPDGGSLACVNLNDDNTTDDGDDGREAIDGDVAPGANDGGDLANLIAGDSDVTEGDGDAGQDDGIGLDHPGSGASTADGRVLHIKLLGQEILVFGQSNSASDDDGSSSDATVLAVLGNEVIGAHSDSEDGSGHDETGLLRETCSETGGGACLALLYGQASSEATDDGSTGSSDTAGGTACLGGGEGASPEGTCDGPVGATVLDTHSDTERDEAGNSSHAWESSNGATLCLGGENEDGVCETLGLVVLHSDSESHAEPGDAEADGGAYVIGIDQGGERTTYIEDETSIALPPDCPEGGSVACLLLNQDETGALADGIGHNGTGLEGDVLPGVLDGENGGDVDATEVGTTAVASEDEDAPEEPEEPPVVKPHGPETQDPTVQGAQASQLPFTGMDTSTMLAIAIMLLLSGAGILILASRRESQTR